MNHATDELADIDPPGRPDFRSALEQWSSANPGREFLLYVGPISFSGWIRFGRELFRKKPTTSECTLALCTFGGDPACAFRMGRLLQARYKRISVLIVGHCKSAGTLLATAADELVFGPFGELGPLDVQAPQKDEVGSHYVSSLEPTDSLRVVGDATFLLWQRYLLRTIAGSGGRISTKTAAALAAELAVGIASPIAAQIDPYRLGAMARASEIAVHYARKLGLRNIEESHLERLVQEYPDHGFVIDKREAAELFKCVRWMSPEEYPLASLLPVLPQVGSQNPDDDDVWVLRYGPDEVGAEEVANEDSEHQASSSFPPGPGDAEELPEDGRRVEPGTPGVLPSAETDRPKRSRRRHRGAADREP